MNTQKAPEISNGAGSESKRLSSLADSIVQVIKEARESAARQINTTMVVAYWNVGRYIVEFEQHGSAKAGYGTGLLTNLSRILQTRLGRGYSRPNLNNMRKFYLAYPICQNVSDKLNWSQICELITIDDPMERRFYEVECVKENWDVRALRRQMPISSCQSTSCICPTVRNLFVSLMAY